MKRFTTTVSLLFLAASAAMAQAPAATPAAPPAQTAAPVPGTKIAIIDFRKAVTESDPGLAASAEYQKEMGSVKTVFDKLEKEITDLRDKATNAKTDAERNDFNRQIEAKQRDGTRINEDAQKLSEELQERLLPPIAQMVQKELDTYATENNLAVVLDPTSEPNNVVHFSTASEITAEIMRRVNVEYAKNPGAAVAAPAAPATATPPTQN